MNGEIAFAASGSTLARALGPAATRSVRGRGEQGVHAPVSSSRTCFSERRQRRLRRQMKPRPSRRNTRSGVTIAATRSPVFRPPPLLVVLLLESPTAAVGAAEAVELALVLAGVDERVDDRVDALETVAEVAAEWVAIDDACEAAAEGVTDTELVPPAAV